MLPNVKKAIAAIIKNGAVFPANSYRSPPKGYPARTPRAPPPMRIPIILERAASSRKVSAAKHIPETPMQEEQTP